MGTETTPMRTAAPAGQPTQYDKDQIVELLRGTNPAAVSTSGERYLDFADKYQEMRTKLRNVADDLADVWKGPASVEAQKDLRELFIAAHEIHTRANQVGTAVKTHGDSYLTWYKDSMPAPDTDAEAQSWMDYANRRVGETWQALPPELSTGLPPVGNGAETTGTYNGSSAGASASGQGPGGSGPGAHSSYGSPARHGTQARYEPPAPIDYGSPDQGGGSSGTELAGYTPEPTGYGGSGPATSGPGGVTGSGGGTGLTPPVTGASGPPGALGFGSTNSWGPPAAMPGTGSAPPGAGNTAPRPAPGAGTAPGSGATRGTGTRPSPVVPMAGGTGEDGRPGGRRPPGQSGQSGQSGTRSGKTQPASGVLAGPGDPASKKKSSPAKRGKDGKKATEEPEDENELTDELVDELVDLPDDDGQAEDADQADEEGRAGEDWEATDPQEDADDEDPFGDLEAEISLDDLDLPTDWAVDGLDVPTDSEPSDDK